MQLILDCMKSISDKIISEALTYDDVLLVPGYSKVLPREVSITSKFSKNIPLNIPIVSAAMDTVTESRMAIAIAQEGGLGVIHKNMSIKKQAEKIRRVKRAESGMIIDPVTLPMNSKVSDAKKSMKENKIGGIPIVDDSGLLKGIVTNRDMRFEKNDDKLITEVMTKDNLITVGAGTSLEEAEVILQENKIEKLPVVTKSNKLVGLITFSDIIKLKLKPIANKDKYGRLRVAAAIGVTDDSLERSEALIKCGVDAIVVDTAHGHTERVVNLLKKLKKNFKEVDIIVGNIATAEAAKFLIKAGADGIKVGIGPGSICTTRIIAGVGVPQFSAITEIYEASKKSAIPLIADGGIRYSGDLAKAIGAGADCVMIGSLLAGTEESPGEVFLYQGRSYKSYRGMGSLAAMEKGSSERYFQQDVQDRLKFVPEGVEGRVPFKGSCTDVIFQLVGGLRASMGYTGNMNILNMQKNCKFQKITSAGVKESHPHDVRIVKEAPNYSASDS